MKCSPLTAAFVSAVLAGLTHMEDGRKDAVYPEPGKDDGRVSKEAWHDANQKEVFANMATASTLSGAAGHDTPYMGPTHLDYQRERDHERRFARQRALEIASDVVRSGDGVESEVVPLADKFYSFILDGAIDPQPINLGAVSTEQLVAELSARVVGSGA